MKKFCFLFVVFCSIFIISTNVSAASIDENVIKFYQDNYSEYIEDYWVIGECNNTYFMYTSDSKDMVIRGDNVQMTNKGDTNINIRLIQLNISDMSKKKNSSVSVSKNQASSILFIKYGGDYANYFYYSNYDIYDSNGKLILEKTHSTGEEVEPEPSPSPSPSPSPEPSPEPSAPSEGEGENAYEEVLILYMSYFLCGLPIALLIVCIGNILAVAFDLLLGRSRW